MMNITAGTKLPLLGELIIYDETQSIVQTIRSLVDNNNTIVACLIFIFSIAVPVFKALLILLVLLIKKLKYRPLVYQFVAIISKWSMADVFVVGVFIAFLATQSNPNIHASLHAGFYYFTAYCVISIMGIQLASLAPVPNSQVSKRDQTMTAS